jgi:hypothetical protein
MIYIDAHVHLHDCFNLISFFNHAEKNILNTESCSIKPKNISCYLFLTEASNENYFEKIQETSADSFRNSLHKTNGWKFYPTSEPFSIIITNDTGFRIILIAGQQLQTTEGLEVLAVAPKRKLVEGKPIEQMISEVFGAEGIAIVPWGFGKWMGRRGTVLKGFIERSKSSLFFLGDNRGRPRFLPDPILFRHAKQKFIRILPGSDPLPFPSEVRRVGSFGLSFTGEISSEKPFGDLKQKITSPGFEFNTFGRLEMPGKFIKQQLLMQIVKMKKRSFK